MGRLTYDSRRCCRPGGEDQLPTERRCCRPLVVKSQPPTKAWCDNIACAIYVGPERNSESESTDRVVRTSSPRLDSAVDCLVRRQTSHRERDYIVSQHIESKCLERS